MGWRHYSFCGCAGIASVVMGLCTLVPAGDREGYVEKFLAARTLDDLEIDSREFDFVFQQAISAAIADAPGKVGDVALHAEELIRHQQRQGGGWHRSMWNGWTILAGTLGRIDDDLSDAGALSMYVRTYRADVNSVIPVSGSYVVRTKGALVRDFYAFGGNYRPREAMDQLSDHILGICGEGEWVFLSFIFARFGDYIRPRQHREVVAWADEVISGERAGHQGIAGAVRFGMEMFFLLRTSAGESSTLSIPEHERINEKLIATLQRDDLSATWRLGLAGFLCSAMPARMTDSLRLEIGRLCEYTYANEVPFSSAGMSVCLEAFVHGSDQGEEWREVAAVLAKSWRHRNRLNSESKNEGRALDPSSSTVVPMTAVLTRLGDVEAIDWQLKEFGSNRGTMPGMFVNLVRDGYFSQARRIFLERASDVRYRDDHYRYGPRYDRKLHKAVPGFLATMKEDEWQDYASLLLAATPDADREFLTDDKFPQRAQRIRTVVKKLSERGYRWVEPKLVVKDVLATSEGSEETQEALGSLSADLIPHFHANPQKQADSSAGTYWMVYHHFHEAGLALFRGEEFPAQFLWARIVYEEEQRHHRLLRNGCEAVVDSLIARLNREFAREKKEGVRPALHFCRQVLEGVPTQVYRQDVSDFLNTVLIAHAWCGEKAAFDGWWGQLEEERKRFLVGVLRDEKGLLGKTRELLNPRYLDPAEWVTDEMERRRFFTDLVSTELVNQGYDQLVLVSYGYARGLLTEEDVEAIVKVVAEKAPRGGIAFHEYFGALSDNGNLKNALQQSNQWIEKSSSSEDAEEQNYEIIAALKLEKALMHEALGEPEEAKKVMKSFAYEGSRKTGDFGAYENAVRATLLKNTAE